MKVVMDPSYKNAQWIVTGHSLGGSLAQVYTNLVNSQQIACGMSKISRCVSFAPAAVIYRENCSCISKDIYSMYINGKDPVVRCNGDNLEDWAFNWVREHSDLHGELHSWASLLLYKVSHYLLGFPCDALMYSHGHQKTYYQSSENEFHEDLSYNQRCERIRFVDGFPFLNSFCHWHSSGSYEFNFWRKHQFKGRADDLAEFRRALEHEGGLAEFIYNYLFSNLRLVCLSNVFKFSSMALIKIVERFLEWIIPSEISIVESLFGTYWPFKNRNMN